MERKQTIPFSVVMSVYKNDVPEYFDLALKSIYEQTLMPNEIVLVVDGSVPDGINTVISKYAMQSGIRLRVLRLKVNKGLGYALHVAVKSCNYDLVARMDSDDICCNNRFELQIERFLNSPELSIVGGNIVEFIDSTEKQVGIREVPQRHQDIIRYMKMRCPFNHVTVMFKRDNVLEAGNYNRIPFNEDYYLWIKMYENNCRFCNIDETLVYVRVGAEMYQRRGGLKYFQSECAIQKYMMQRKIIDKISFIKNIIIRFIVEICMPNYIRGMFFKTVLRKNIRRQNTRERRI